MSENPLLGMRIGQIMPMTACSVLHGDPKGEYLRPSFRARKGRRFVFLFLGDESADGTTDPLDVVQRLYDLGWSHPEFKPGQEARTIEG